MSTTALSRSAGKSFGFRVTMKSALPVSAHLNRRHVRSPLIGKIIGLIRERAESVEVHSSIELSPDPDDNPFCSFPCTHSKFLP